MKHTARVAALSLSFFVTLGAIAQDAGTRGKRITDKAEYDSYMSAVRTTVPGEKAAALESFLRQYPNSVMKTDALEILLGTYQQTGNVQKVQDTAANLLQADPKSTSALAVMSFLLKAKMKTQDVHLPHQLEVDAQLAQQYALQGLQAMKVASRPENVSDADWEKRKAQLSSIFNSTLGFSYLLQKRFAEAEPYLEDQVKANPQDLESTYQLSLSLLEQNPPNRTGLWYGARAMALASTNPKASDEIEKYVKSKYASLHSGSDKGFKEFVRDAQKDLAPTR